MAEAEKNPIKPLKWGILGAARIAAKSLIPAIRAAGGEVISIGASSRERAADFADVNAIPRACQGYQGVLDDSAVEAVYIPLSNSLHLEWALKTARAGKACLCEKPMVLSAGDARELRSIFERAGCRLQEAFMWRHHAQAAWAETQVASGAIGALQRVNATFSFPLDRPNDYRWKASQGGGALWDIGCYCVNASRYFVGEEPLACSARATFTPGDESVDESAAGWLDFGGGRYATISCSFKAAFHQGIELVGTQGRIWIGSPWLQVGQTTHAVLERDNKRTVQDFEPMNSYTIMVENFTRAVRDPSFALRPAEDGYAQAVAMEGILRSAKKKGEVHSFGK